MVVQQDATGSLACGRPRQWSGPQRGSGSEIVCSSSNLHTADKFQLNLCLAYRRVERRLTHARTGARPIRVEQIENAALTGVVTHLRDTFNLIGTVDC